MIQTSGMDEAFHSEEVGADQRRRSQIRHGRSRHSRKADGPLDKVDHHGSIEVEFHDL